MVFVHALLFVGGFTLVFVAGWGGAATLVGGIFAIYKPLLAVAGGIIIIIFGLTNLGVLRIPWLMYDTRPQWEPQRKKGFFASGMTGLALVLSGANALGLGIPFLAIGLSMDRAASFGTRFRHSLRWIQKVSGFFLIVIGILMVTHQMFYISIWAQRNGLFLDLPLGAAAAPTQLIALVAGLFSFLSPCVLPLVPANIGYLGGHTFREAQ
jgi:cytochrome c-type biogenesis protein